MKAGYILRMIGSTRHYFQSFVKGNLVFVEDKKYAWFTQDMEIAQQMIQDLSKKEIHCVTQAFAHE